MTKAQKKVFRWLNEDFRNANWVLSVMEIHLQKQSKYMIKGEDENLRGFIEDFDKAFVNKEE